MYAYLVAYRPIIYIYVSFIVWVSVGAPRVICISVGAPWGANVGRASLSDPPSPPASVAKSQGLLG